MASERITWTGSRPTALSDPSRIPRRSLLRPPLMPAEPAMPDLPEYLTRPPFGTDPETGESIDDIRGLVVVAAISCMEDSASRAAGASPPIDELVRHANRAIADPKDHVSPQILRDPDRHYSYEFFALLLEHARRISGDPDFHFHRGIRSIPRFLVTLTRPLSLRRIYALVPRLTAKVTAADVRVVRVDRHRATIQLHMDRELAPVPDPLKPYLSRAACRSYQGAYAVIPTLHAGLPMATITEHLCILNGDPCCEWEFQWTARGTKERLGTDQIPATVPAPASARPARTSLEPLPPRMSTAPFGTDADGRPIKHVPGITIVGCIEQMRRYIGETLRSELADLQREDRRDRIELAQEAAVDELVGRLNAAVPGPRFRVTREYLLAEGNSYSYEFNLYTTLFAQEISGDPDFAFHRGLRSVPAGLITITRSFGLKQVFRLLPRFAAKVTRSDVRVVRVGTSSATLQWFPDERLELLPSSIHQQYLSTICPAYQGVFASIPFLHSGLGLADVTQSRCVLKDDDCCEWTFSWQGEERESRLGPLVGVGLSAVLLTALYGYPAAALPLAVVGALLPAIAAAVAARIRGITQDRELAEERLDEQRQSSEQHFDALQQANTRMQLANADLEQKLGELTTHAAIGQTLRTTLDLDALLRGAIQTLTGHLSVERATILLADRHGRALKRGARGDGTGAEALTGLDIPIEGNAPLGHMFAEGTGFILEPSCLGFPQDPPGLAVPLIAKGHPVGLLWLDNPVSRRDVAEQLLPLATTVGDPIAAAVDGAFVYETLERRIRDRTREAEEAQSAAESANRAKSSFLANMSHELRTPLNAIIGYSEMLMEELEETGQSDLHGDVRKVHTSARHLLVLINDVLDLSKIEAGKMEVFLETVALGPLIEQAAETVRPMVEQKGNTIEIPDAPSGLPTVTADALKLRQALLNLLNNASKFTEEGLIRVEVETRSSDGDPRVEIRVRDTGIGMSPDQLERIFQPFTQAEADTTRRFGGTGLGLVISRHFCRMMGGDITVSSREGRGSTFTVTLPAAPPPDLPSDDPPPQVIA